MSASLSRKASFSAPLSPDSIDLRFQERRRTGQPFDQLAHLGLMTATILHSHGLRQHFEQ
jgi:hypothetical protein